MYPDVVWFPFGHLSTRVQIKWIWAIIDNRPVFKNDKNQYCKGYKRLRHESSVNISNAKINGFIYKKKHSEKTNIAGIHTQTTTTGL